MSGTLTRINNNQITNAISGNTYFGIDANAKIQPYSITSNLLANNFVYSSNLTVQGDLCVTGNVTAINTTNITIEDPLLLLANNQTGTPTVDIGYIGQRGTSNNIAFVWDESLKSFVTVYTSSGAGDNTNITILSYADLITGNANVTGDLTAGNVSLNGNVTTNLNVTGNIAGGNISTVGKISATGNITANYYFGNGSQLTGIITQVSNISNGNSSANIGTAGGNMVVTIGNTLVSTFYNNGVNFTGNISVTGTATAGNVVALTDVSALGNVVSNNALNGNSLSLSGNVTSALNVTGTVTANNINSVNNISATGNVYGANFAITGSGGNITGANVIASTTLTATGNVYGGNIVSAGKVSALGNIQTGNYFIGDGYYISNINAANVATTKITNGGSFANISSSNGNLVVAVGASSNSVATFYDTGVNLNGLLNVQGNIVAANIFANAQISAAGNVITNQTFVGNALTGNTLIVTSTYAGLQFSVTGNINAGNTWITNVPDPVNPTDVANKEYVDSIANGLQVKASSNTATTGNILTSTGFAYTYNNGTAGVGATITFNTVGNVTIDTVLLTTGMRVLIKDEPQVAPTNGTTPSAAYNGIYSVTTAGSPGSALVLTRTTDDDTSALMYSAYTFITDGSVNKLTGWSSTNTPTSPGDPIVVGTTQYIWTQFSQAGSYTAGNALSLTGTTFNVLYDGSTIGVNGSNQLYIPANAPLVTPNIGDATGNSLSVTGSVTGLSLLGSVISASGAITGDTSVVGGIFLAAEGGTGTTGYSFQNDGGYDTGMFSTADGVVQFYANNQEVANFGTGGWQFNNDVDMNAYSINNAANVNATGDVSTSGNVIAANFTTTGPQGNITGANVISAVTITATGNVGAGQYLFGDGAYISNINAANVSSTKISNGGSYANIATPDGNLVIAVGAGSNVAATFYDNGVNFGGDISTIGNVNVGSGNVIDSANVGIQLFSNYYAQLNYDDTSYVWVNNSGVHLETTGQTLTLSTTGDVSAPGTISAVGNVYASAVGTTSDVSAGGNVIGGNILTGGFVSATGNVIADYIFGNIVSSAGNIQAGTTFLADTITGTVTLGANITETAGATLAVNSTDSMLIPVGNVAQRPVTPTTGMLRFNSTNSQCEVWNGTEWTAVGGTPFTVIQNEQFNGDGSTVTFTLGSSQTTNSCIVTINGVVQIPTTAYAVSGVYPSCVLTFTEAPAVGDTIDVREITTTVTVTSLMNTSGNAMVTVDNTAANVNITGALVVDSGTGYIYGDGTYITNVGGGNIVATRIQSGNSQVNISTPGGEIYMAVGGSNVFDISSAQTTLWGNLNPNGNNTQSLGNSTNRWSNLWISGNTIYIGGSNITANATTLSFGGAPIVTQNANGNISGGNVTATTVSASGNIIGNYLIGNGATLSSIAGGNVTGTVANATYATSAGSATTAATVTGNAQANITSVGTLSSLTVTANTSSGNLLTAGIVSATGNITTAGYFVGTFSGNISGNLTVPGANTQILYNNSGNAGASSGFTFNQSTNVMTVSGNTSTGNLLTSGLVSATGNITGNYHIGNGSTLSSITGGNVTGTVANATYATSAGSATTAATVTGNAQANITSVGTLSSLAVTANITGGNLLTGGLISATGNVSGASLIGTIATASQPTITSLGTLTSLSVTGNTTGGNFTTSGTLSVGGITLSGNLIVGAGPTLTIDPNGSGGTDGNVVITGNLTVQGTTTTINSNTVTTNDLQINMANNAATASAANNGGIGVGPAGAEYASLLYNNASNVWVASLGISSVGNVSGASLIGTIATASQPSITSVGTLSSLAVTANITGGNILTGGLISATGNITGGNLSVGTGTITVGNIVNSNANAVGNIGSSSNYFNTIFAQATAALYADLAELYLADAEYAPGTVVSFGGDFEVTGSDVDSDARVAGIVSTNPSYLMNSGLTGENVAAVALQGRVPCSVTGAVRKGDMLVSNGDGSARAEANPAVGTVIGKALANFDGEIGIIEVVVGIR